MASWSDPHRHCQSRSLGTASPIGNCLGVFVWQANKPSGELAGIARLNSDPDHEIAEYAVLVRTDLQGQGLGWELLRQLINFARADGVKQIEGLILSENKKMLTLCREFGFSISHHPSDQSLMLATLNLQRA
ncbi:GNAT family N-acetyltransferase [Phyllobacterium endophyticum]|uniref:N-acetyltransferase domain-containing protein n=1 Tax=Phyllobacterium endophyticum TaxID=1149773 RepID=A0A2P7ASV7_9HYPH|nr:GNAT family N-acetyltransferase [Phyllobacterium endophyticum]PSH57299.1 hypothetical protein CU100_17855 [Phyllobacterium endophyticum]TYR40402.1 GNAT family N-acetyltransferase [Phyllobacterium endophyticum]